MKNTKILIFGVMVLIYSVYAETLPTYYQGEKMPLFTESGLNFGMNSVVNLSYEDNNYMLLQWKAGASNALVNLPFEEGFYYINITSDTGFFHIRKVNKDGSNTLVGLNTTVLGGGYSRGEGQFYSYHGSFYFDNNFFSGVTPVHYKYDSYIQCVQGCNATRIQLYEPQNKEVYLLAQYRNSATTRNFSHHTYIHTIDNFSINESLNTPVYTTTLNYMLCGEPSGLTWIDCLTINLDYTGEWISPLTVTKNCGFWVTYDPIPYYIDYAPVDSTIQLDENVPSDYQVFISGLEVKELHWMLQCSSGILGEWTSPPETSLHLAGLGEGAYMLSVDTINQCGTILESHAWNIEVEKPFCNFSYQATGINLAGNDFNLSGANVSISYSAGGGGGIGLPLIVADSEGIFDALLECEEEYTFFIKWRNASYSCNTSMLHHTYYDLEVPFINQILIKCDIEKTNITVRLIDSITGDNVSYEYIRLYKGKAQEEKLISTCVTNTYGLCVFDLMAIGDSYAVKFDKEGYIPATARFLLADHGNYFELYRTPKPTSYKVTFRVKDTSGVIIKGAECTVTLKGNMSSYSASYFGFGTSRNMTKYTDNKGECQFILESFYGYDFVFKYFPYFEKEAGYTIANLTRDLYIEISLSPQGKTARITGVVYDNSTQGALSGVTVTVKGISPSNILNINRQEITDEIGSFRFQYVPSDMNYVYEISASLSGYETNTFRYTIDNPQDYYFAIYLARTTGVGGKSGFWQFFSGIVWNFLALISMLVMVVVVLKLADAMMD